MKKQKYSVKNETYTPEIIHLKLGTSIELIPRLAQIQVTKYLSLLPKDVIDFIVEHYVFIGQEKYEMGTHFPFCHRYFRGKRGFILLNNELWKTRPIEKAFVIAHEVAHAYNEYSPKTFFNNFIERRIKREEEANKLAVVWLSKHFKKSNLIKII